MIIPDEVYDDWMPCLGAMAIGIYGAICRLSEQQEEVRVKDLEATCLVHTQTLSLICRKMSTCGLIEISDPVAHLETVVMLLPLPAIATRGTPILFGSARLLPEVTHE